MFNGSVRTGRKFVAFGRRDCGERLGWTGWWVVGGGVGTAEIKFKKILRQDDMNNFTSYNVHSQPATETGYDS